jgi:hypothetical protein
VTIFAVCFYGCCDFVVVGASCWANANTNVTGANGKKLQILPLDLVDRPHFFLVEPLFFRVRHPL